MKNDPSLWQSVINDKTGDKHKYDYGYVVVYAGPRMTGAASLASIAALRMGAGVVAVVADPEIAGIFRHYSPSLIVDEIDRAEVFSSQISDPKKNTVLIGPGAGQDDAEGLRTAVLDAIGLGKITVVDADALTSFKENPERLFKKLNNRCILTPHTGEFARLFPDIKGSKQEMAVKASQKSGAIIVLKGQTTVIAAPEGRVVSSDRGTGWLATAGTGDVLAGMIAGLSAWHENHLFEACCAAVWMHGEIAQIIGPGLISEDMPEKISEAWKKILN